MPEDYQSRALSQVLHRGKDPHRPHTTHARARVVRGRKVLTGVRQMTICVQDTLCKYRGAQPGAPLLPLWREVTFGGALPKYGIWRSKAMLACKPKGWTRIRVHSRYHAYVKFRCYDPAAFGLIDANWIEEMLLKLLLIQES
jgi:hypothetical protein